jgi:mannose-1-phosphate guanylyltransferase
LKLARRDKLAIFGIPPQSPETAYGYIEAAAPLGPDTPEAFTVASFREKPDRLRAEQFLGAGNFYWNSGMFAFSSRFMAAEFRRAVPELFAPFEALTAPPASSYGSYREVKILEDWPGLGEAYARSPKISIDYAIVEKSAAIAMVRAAFRWSDIGSWDEYARLVENTGSEVYSINSAGNSAGASGTATDPAESCFVDSDIPVSLIGTENLIVVVRSGKDGSPPSVLIARKGETQGVREIVEKIRKAGRAELL